MQNIKKLIDAKGVKPTLHRIKILEYLMTHENHPTVDRIYEDIVSSIPTISKTTVYNTLKIFVNKDIITELTITGSETHYDIKGDDHHHFYCTQCKKIFDIHSNCNYDCNLKKDIDGNRINTYQCYYKGICKNCLNKTKIKRSRES
ncbi:MAG: Fur family transcriptional regulator [Fidelibacterota bacterium]